jgi:palmitoyltransferase
VSTIRAVTDFLCADDNFLSVGFFGTSRIGSGIAVLADYWTLFVLVTSSFFRMLWTIYRYPGFIERGPNKHAATFEDEKTEQTLTKLLEMLSFPAPTLDDVLPKDVFVCQPDGTPRWCTTCRIWRPDRSRHCREKDRCVLKLDHFCPWVGGIVSEQSMKCFILFNSYTCLYTIFDWILAAVCIAQRDRQQSLDGRILAMLILGLFFMGLTGGIGFSAILNGLTNHTTVENTAEPSGHRWTMALRVPSGQAVPNNVRTITFPSACANTTGPEILRKLLEDAREKSPVTNLDHENTNPVASHMGTGRTFVIITSDAFANPWDCGMYENWCQVMGRNIVGWFLPIEFGSPWFSHRAYVPENLENGTTSTSFFPTSVDVQIMRARAGLIDLSAEETSEYEDRLARRRTLPYLLGGAGAPRVLCLPVSQAFSLVLQLTCTALLETMGVFARRTTTA